MKKSLRRLSYVGIVAVALTLMFTVSAFSATTSYAYTASPTASSWQGITTGWANVRSGPTTTARIITVFAPGTSVTVYATVTGQTVWSGPNWYQIRSGSSPQYIYNGLVNKVSSSSSSSSGTGSGATPSAKGKEILVNRAKQWMYVYQDGVQVYDSPVTTGRPELYTPAGTYHVLAKLHPTWFTSPWPYGSPYWYPATFINYALEFSTIGLFLHDSYWRGVYGPGTNVWHYDPISGWTTGTHGCVTMPLSSVIWLYNWAPVGTTVQVI